MRRHGKPILVLMGPTASGKSALACFLAQQCSGVIINADAMQCYDRLPVLTACPRAEEMQGISHQLYGIWQPNMHGNAQRWVEAATAAIRQAHQEHKVPILVGGTGMYIKALVEGMAPIPPISDGVKQWMRALAAEPVTFLYEMLEMKDPKAAEALQPNDRQRILRALEVIAETKRSLIDWQQDKPVAPFLATQFHYYYVKIPRETLYARINRRFEAMMNEGAIREVEGLSASFSPQEWSRRQTLDYPILRAHGVPELLDYLEGKISRDEAIARAQQNTRHYAKRQMTWLRGQLPQAVPMPYQPQPADGDLAASHAEEAADTVVQLLRA